MSCQFYYDSMIDSEELTYRIIGIPSTNPNKNQIPDQKDAKVIIKDLIREPLSFSVMHSYSNDGSSIVNWRSNLQAFLASASRQYGEFSAEFRKLLASFNIGGFDDTITSADYKKTLSWVDYLKSFESTKISIPLSFTARIYPRIKGRESDGLRDVRAQVNDISECFIGKATTDNKNTTLTYYAPHGYVNNEPDPNLKTLKGTLTLMYGKYAVLEGLLLSSYNVTFAREFVRISPDPSSSLVSPAYADISFTLIPALALTQNDLIALLQSDYLAAREQNKNLGSWFDKATLENVNDDYVNEKINNNAANPVTMSQTAKDQSEKGMNRAESYDMDELKFKQW